MKRFVDRCWWPLLITLLLNLVCQQPVMAKTGLNASALISEIHNYKRFKKMMKATVPMVTLLGTLGMRAHQQHHPMPHQMTPAPPRTVIIHVPKPLPIPVPVPIYHYNIERHHHHKPKPRVIYLKNRKSKSRGKKRPNNALLFHGTPSGPHTVLDLPFASAAIPMYGAAPNELNWADEEIHPDFLSPADLNGPVQSFAEGNDIIGLGNHHNGLRFTQMDVPQGPTYRRSSPRRTARLYNDDYDDDAYH